MSSTDLKSSFGNLIPGDLVNVQRRGIYSDPTLPLVSSSNEVFPDHPVMALVLAISDDVWPDTTAALVLTSTIMGWISTKQKIPTKTLKLIVDS